MSGAASNWPRELREHLTKTYEYDKETGLVTRRYEPNKGPKQKGSVGSPTRTGDLSLTVWVGAKAYTIRVAKLCVFLETGFLYEKVAHRDNCKMNNVWSNLQPIGMILEEGGDLVQMKEEQREQAIAEWKSKKTEILLGEDKAREEAKLKTTQMLEGHKRSKTVEKKDEVNPQVYQAELERMQKASIELEKDLMYAYSRRVGWYKYNELRQKYKAMPRDYHFKVGIYTGMSESDLLSLFEEPAEKEVGMSCYDWYKKWADTDEAEQLKEDKWKYDLRMLGHWRKLEMSGYEGIVSKQVENYKWNGEEYKPKFETEEKNRANYLLELHELELSLGKTEIEMEHEWQELLAIHNAPKEPSGPIPSDRIEELARAAQEES